MAAKQKAVLVKPSLRTKEAIEFVNENNDKLPLGLIKSELDEYQRFCQGLKPSIKTHYDNIDEWSEEVYNFIHEKLSKHGFVNGGAAMGIAQPLMADFWWNIYKVLSSIVYSPNLETDVAVHHSSAYSRNEALKKEIDLLLSSIE